MPREEGEAGRILTASQVLCSVNVKKNHHL